MLQRVTVLYKPLLIGALTGTKKLVPLDVVSQTLRGMLGNIDINNDPSDVNAIINNFLASKIVLRSNVSNPDGVRRDIGRRLVEDVLELRNWLIWGMRYVRNENQQEPYTIQVYATPVQTTPSPNIQKLKETLDNLYFRGYNLTHEQVSYDINLKGIYPAEQHSIHDTQSNVKIEIKVIPPIQIGQEKYIIFDSRVKSGFLLKKEINANLQNLNILSFDENITRTINNVVYVGMLPTNLLGNTVESTAIRKFVLYFDYLVLSLNNHFFKEFTGNSRVQREVELEDDTDPQQIVKRKITTTNEESVITNHDNVSNSTVVQFENIIERFDNEWLSTNGTQSIQTTSRFVIDLPGDVLKDINETIKVYGVVVNNASPFILWFADEFRDRNAQNQPVVLDRFLSRSYRTINNQPIIRSQVYWGPTPVIIQLYRSQISGQNYYIAINKNTNAEIKIKIKI